MLTKSAAPYLLAFITLAFLPTSTDGFGVHPKGSLSSLLSENSRGITSSRLQYQNEESPTSSTTSTKERIEGSQANTIDQEWGLREDWALQDSVPRYTVGTNAFTFWTQLRHSIPELARWPEEVLEKKYKEWYSLSKDSLLIDCGPSPTLLSDWWVKSSDDAMMMGGSLPNGSKIWFPLKYAGTLGDDPTRISSSEGLTKDTLDDFYISSFMTLHTSSYAESTGGVVYDLGFPRCEANKIHGPRTDDNGTTRPARKLEQIDAVQDESVGLGVKQLEKLRDGAVSKATQNVGAILAASTLSACVALGYAAGHNSSPPVSAMQNRQGAMVTAAANGSNKDKISYYTSTSVSRLEPTVSEQRARVELKVGRDKRSLVLMQERLKADELELENLRKEESRLEAIEWGFQK
ncbi:unnamed protein product [Pseudo-nitzschia multistriata]|uniref:Uncharacterized protein n=1 Tax=Pseudo-nitzschia multistriata TaxID=183589 RepID=A0A448ZEU3_9STRA|nr:unnamed protein product [Pseudo-nitzschia multistriata]